ncbi:MAG: F0F1 ATP synthase subunit I [Gammaproteobacteria bacterium]|nr:MAG: F0F1 ATP synthase subunit I [Gammaproteobacteria bacterium]TNF05925.1 MAG: F0F1 ATP synthase subunit I [Gammaproteobacteria bacterium]
MGGSSVMKATIKVPPVGRIALIQLATLMVATLITLPIDVTLSSSLMIGGIIHILPHAYFTRWAFRYQGARQAPKILRAIYRGETGKILLTLVLFGLTFKYVEALSLPALFLGYGAMVIVQWLGAAKALNTNK